MQSPDGVPQPLEHPAVFVANQFPPLLLELRMPSGGGGQRPSGLECEQQMHPEFAGEVSIGSALRECPSRRAQIAAGHGTGQLVHDVGSMDERGESTMRRRAGAAGASPPDQPELDAVRAAVDVTDQDRIPRCAETPPSGTSTMRASTPDVERQSPRGCFTGDQCDQRPGPEQRQPPAVVQGDRQRVEHEDLR